MSILSLFPITEEEIEDIGSGGTSTAPGQRGGRKVLVDARVESQRCRKFHRVRKGWPFRSRINCNRSEAKPRRFPGGTVPGGPAEDQDQLQWL